MIGHCTLGLIGDRKLTMSTRRSVKHFAKVRHLHLGHLCCSTLHWIYYLPYSRYLSFLSSSYYYPGACYPCGDHYSGVFRGNRCCYHQHNTLHRFESHAHRHSDHRRSHTLELSCHSNHGPSRPLLLCERPQDTTTLPASQADPRAGRNSTQLRRTPLLALAWPRAADRPYPTLHPRRHHHRQRSDC